MLLTRPQQSNPRERMIEHFTKETPSIRSDRITRKALRLGRSKLSLDVTILNSEKFNLRGASFFLDHCSSAPTGEAFDLRIAPPYWAILLWYYAPSDTSMGPIFHLLLLPDRLLCLRDCARATLFTSTFPPHTKSPHRRNLK